MYCWGVYNIHLLLLTGLVIKLLLPIRFYLDICMCSSTRMRVTPRAHEVDYGPAKTEIASLCKNLKVLKLFN